VRTAALSRSAVGTISVLAASTLWGTTGTASALAPGLGPLAVGAAAMGIGGVLQATTACRGLVAERGELATHWRLVVLGALAIMVYPLAFYSSMRLAGVAVGTVISIGAAPVAAAVIERLVDRQALSRRWVLSAAAGVGGVLALTLAHGGGSEEHGAASGWGPVLGIVLGLVAAVTYAVYSWVAARLMRQGVSSRSAMGALFGLGGVLLLPVLVVTGGPILDSGRDLAVVAYLAAVPMFLGYVLFGRGLATVSASTATTLSLLEPVVAAGIAIAVLHERLPPVGWLGMALVLASLAILTVGGTGPRRTADDQDEKCLSTSAWAFSRWRAFTPSASSSHPNTQLEITPSKPTEASAVNTSS
jgi:DME family drug/metabolite transporter